MTPLPRRAALLGAASMMGAATISDHGDLPGGSGLNERAMRGNRFYGAAIDHRILAADRPYMAQVVRECGAVTAEAAFKWGAIRPKPGSFDFEHADKLMAFAARHAMMVRGHTLLWHEDNPAWLVDTLTPANAECLLVAHIRTVAGHCRNRVVHWDVANEVLRPEDGKPFGLRDTLWTRAMGPECLDAAFHACAAADPTALRCLNDYGLDYGWDGDERKREAMLALLARLRARGVPVQALGTQAHLDAAIPALSQAKLARFCADVASLGLKIVITELDVRDNQLPADPAVRDAAVASHARAYLDAMLDSPAVLGVLSWGLSDRRTWLNDALPRDDKLPQRPLPLDDQLRRKPMWQAMVDAFAAAPPRA